MSDQGIFRAEFSRQATDLAGKVSVPPSRGVMITAIASLGSLLLGVIVLTQLRQTVTERAIGFVTLNSNRAVVASPIAGAAELTNILVREGQMVVSGNALAIVKGDDLSVSPLLADRTRVVVLPIASDDSRKAAVLISAADGYVDRLLANSGRSLRAGQPLLTLAQDANRFKLEILVSSRVIERVSVRDRLYVRVNSYAFRDTGTIAGSVEGVSAYAISPGEIASLYGTAPPSESKFVLSLLFDEAELVRMPSLHPGTSVEVKIPLGEQTLLSWVFSSLVKGKESSK